MGGVDNGCYDISLLALLYVKKEDSTDKKIYISRDLPADYGRQ